MWRRRQVSNVRRQRPSFRSQTFTVRSADPETRPVSKSTTVWPGPERGSSVGAMPQPTNRSLISIQDETSPITKDIDASNATFMPGQRLDAAAIGDVPDLNCSVRGPGDDASGVAVAGGTVAGRLGRAVARGLGPRRRGARGENGDAVHLPLVSFQRMHAAAVGPDLDSLVPGAGDHAAARHRGDARDVSCVARQGPHAALPSVPYRERSRVGLFGGSGIGLFGGTAKIRTARRDDVATR
mmetsp:Transcript_1942/g.5776  ORF Transcript_1942/g.5776 Transcript_1942/m.5776 type:complete len:240 (+) Transcript_1942:451-1170(+)